MGADRLGNKSPLELGNEFLGLNRAKRTIGIPQAPEPFLTSRNQGLNSIVGDSWAGSNRCNDSNNCAAGWRCVGNFCVPPANTPGGGTSSENDTGCGGAPTSGSSTEDPTWGDGAVVPVGPDIPVINNPNPGAPGVGGTGGGGGLCGTSPVSSWSPSSWSPNFGEINIPSFEQWGSSSSVSGGCILPGCGGLPLPPLPPIPDFELPEIPDIEYPDPGGPGNGGDICCGGVRCCRNTSVGVFCFCGECPPPPPTCNEFATFAEQSTGVTGLGYACSSCDVCNAEGRCEPAPGRGCLCGERCGNCQICTESGTCEDASEFCGGLPYPPGYGGQGPYYPVYDGGIPGYGVFPGARPGPPSGGVGSPGFGLPGFGGSGGGGRPPGGRPPGGRPPSPPGNPPPPEPPPPPPPPPPGPPGDPPPGDPPPNPPPPPPGSSCPVSTYCTDTTGSATCPPKTSRVGSITVGDESCALCEKCPPCPGGCGDCQSCDEETGKCKAGNCGGGLMVQIAWQMLTSKAFSDRNADCGFQYPWAPEQPCPQIVRNAGSPVGGEDDPPPTALEWKPSPANTSCQDRCGLLGKLFVLFQDGELAPNNSFVPPGQPRYSCGYASSATQFNFEFSIARATSWPGEKKSAGQKAAEQIPLCDYQIPDE